MNKKYSRFHYSLSKISILFFLTFLVKTNYSHNVGLGTSTPTHGFHVVRSPGNPLSDSLRLEVFVDSYTNTLFLVTLPYPFGSIATVGNS